MGKVNVATAGRKYGQAMGGKICCEVRVDSIGTVSKNEDLDINQFCRVVRKQTALSCVDLPKEEQGPRTLRERRVRKKQRVRVGSSTRCFVCWMMALGI